MYKLFGSLALAAALAACSGDSTGPGASFPAEVPNVAAGADASMGTPVLRFTVKNVGKADIQGVLVRVNALQGSTVVDDAQAVYTGVLRAGQSTTAPAEFFGLTSHSQYSCYEYTVEVLVQGRSRTHSKTFPKVCK